MADWFTSEGHVVAVRLSGSGRAWVEFSTAEEAGAALARFAGVTLRYNPKSISKSEI